MVPRSTVRSALLAVGAQKVALLPSTAASAYIPGSSELAAVGRQRARSSVGVRSGRRVGIVADELTVRVAPGDSSANALPLRSFTVVAVAARRVPL